MKNFIKDLNIHFYLRLLLIAILPVAGAMHIKGTDITDWQTLFNTIKDFLSNPYLIALFLGTLYQSYRQTKKSNTKKLKGGGPYGKSVK